MKNQTLLKLATQLQENTDREPCKRYCAECDTETDQFRLYPYEYTPLGYIGELAENVCLTCGRL